MPAISKKQFKFMEAVAHGAFKKPGLSPEKAKEYVSGNVGSKSYSHLPKIKNMMRKK